MPTRATKLASVTPVANTPTTVFTVPAGQTFLVKSVQVANHGGANDNAQVWMQDAAGDIVYLLRNAALAPLTFQEWEGVAALTPGDFLVVLSVSGMTHFWVTGTKLPGVA